MCVRLKHSRDWCPFPALTYTLSSAFPPVAQWRLCSRQKRQCQTRRQSLIFALSSRRCVFGVSALTLRFDFLKKYTIKMFVIARLFVKRRLRRDPNARNSDTSVTVQCSLRNACHSGERVRLELVSCLLWRPWYSLQAALRAATSWTRPARPATFTPRGLPLNPIGPEPGWRKLHWEIDWPNPIIIRISQRGLTDCLWNLQTFSSLWGFLLLVKSNVNVCYLMTVNPIVVP